MTENVTVLPYNPLKSSVAAVGCCSNFLQDIMIIKKCIYQFFRCSFFDVLNIAAFRSFLFLHTYLPKITP